ncbi:MAG: GntR family transcriptional regulator [Trueperaceae bacterium]
MAKQQVAKQKVAKQKVAKQQVTKQQTVYESLREEILDGALPPGARLMFAELAQRFEMSPIPVREALRQLERESLIEVHPHVKVVVKAMPLEEAVWASELRMELEPIAVREAMPFVQDHHLRELRARLELMKRASLEDDFRVFLSGYRAYHDVLFALTPNRRMVRIIDALRDTTRRYRSIYRDERQLHGAERDLVGVLDAIERGDGMEVAQRLRAHRERLCLHLKSVGPSHVASGGSLAEGGKVLGAAHAAPAGVGQGTSDPAD